MSESARFPEEPEKPPGFRERLSVGLASAARLASTRLEIFREEASAKALELARALGSFALAAAAGLMVLLLFAALLVALFTLLFGHVWAGVLATLILYGALAAGAAFFGYKALGKVRPLDFPVTSEELAKDWQALTGVPPAASSSGPLGAPGSRPESSMDDVESRFRAGSE